jgi:hypothetical protein
VGRDKNPAVSDLNFTSFSRIAAYAFPNSQYVVDLASARCFGCCFKTSTCARFAKPCCIGQGSKYVTCDILTVRCLIAKESYGNDLQISKSATVTDLPLACGFKRCSKTDTCVRFDKLLQHRVVLQIRNMLRICRAHLCRRLLRLRKRNNIHRPFRRYAEPFRRLCLCNHLPIVPENHLRTVSCL